MTKTMQLRLMSGVIALVVGAGSVWGQGNPTTGGPVDPLLLEDLALSYRILTDHDVMDGVPAARFVDDLVKKLQAGYGLPTGGEQ